jgi:hypothetical protein
VPRKTLLQQGHIAAPFGVNVVSPASAIPDTDGLILLNVVAGDRGLKPRQGFLEHVTGVGSGQVRSLIPYHGSTSAADKLFAATQTNIYDCSVSTGTPTSAHTFATNDAKSGHGIWQNFATTADHYLLYCDETNGYLIYTQGTGLWSAGSVTGVTPGNLVFVMQWKSRVWFVERNTSKAWYLAPGAISGAATSFDFGPLFRSGGYLVGLWTWTVDGGAGMDDFLVAISSSGDVVVFAGSDPSSSATFQQLGEWSTGGVPAGRRIATQFGGDILILTLLGILPLSKLVGGQLVTPDTYETYKIRPLFNQIISTQQQSLGWEMLIHPQDNFLFLNTPGTPGEPQEQFAMSYATRGWARFRGLDVYSAAIWQGNLFFGTRDGRVCKSTGFLDNVARDGTTVNASPVESVVLSSFQTLQSANKKMVRLIRALFIIRDIAPSVQTFARYDFDMRDVSGTIAAPQALAGGSVWDTATWDASTWADTGAVGTYNTVQGATGIGSSIAVGLRMKTSGYTVFVGFDIAWEEGGLL